MDGWSSVSTEVHLVDSNVANAHLREAVRSRGGDGLVDMRNFTDPSDAFPQPQNMFLVHNHEQRNGVGDSFCKANSDLGKTPGLQRLTDHLFAGGAVVTGGGDAILAPCPMGGTDPMDARQALAALLHCVDEKDRQRAVGVSMADFASWRKRNGYARPLGEGSWNEALVLDVGTLLADAPCDAAALAVGDALWKRPLSGGESLERRYAQLASAGVADADGWGRNGSVILRRSLRPPEGAKITESCLEFAVAAFAEKIGVGPKQLAGYLLPRVEENPTTGERQIRRFLITDRSHVRDADLARPDGTVHPSDAYFNDEDAPSENQEPFRPEFAITHIVALAERCHGDCNNDGPMIFTAPNMPERLAELVVTATERGLLHFDIKPANMLYRKHSASTDKEWRLHSLLYTDFDPDFVKIVPRHYASSRVACLCVLQLSILIGTIRCDYAPAGAGLSPAERRAYDFIRDALIAKYGSVEGWAQLCAEALFAKLADRGRRDGSKQGGALRDALVGKHAAAGTLAPAPAWAVGAAAAAKALCPAEGAQPTYYASQAAYDKGTFGGPHAAVYHGPRAVINDALTHHIFMYLRGEPGRGKGKDGTSKNRRCFDGKAGRQSTQHEQREPTRTLGQVVTDVFEFMLAGVQPREPAPAALASRRRRK
jgi:hypothetical protein